MNVFIVSLLSRSLWTTSYRIIVAEWIGIKFSLNRIFKMDWNFIATNKLLNFTTISAELWNKLVQDDWKDENKLLKSSWIGIRERERQNLNLFKSYANMRSRFILPHSLHFFQISSPVVMLRASTTVASVEFRVAFLSLSLLVLQKSNQASEKLFGVCIRQLEILKMPIIIFKE